MVPNRWRLPDFGLGMGLRSVHYDHVLEHRPKVDFFEVISETFLDKGGKPMAILEEVSSHYRILLHGVSMAVGNTDPIDFDYLAKLKKLAQKVKAPFVSDHLCWNAYMCHNSHDLLPIPLTDETLQHVAGRVRQIQDYLELPVALENPTNYLEFKMSQMSEIEYLTRLAEQSRLRPRRIHRAGAGGASTLSPCRGPYRQGDPHRRYSFRPRGGQSLGDVHQTARAPRGP